MKKFINIIVLTLCCCLLQSFQVTPEQQKLYQVRLSMAFGDRITDKEVYLFTSWNDEATAKLEPFIEKLAPEIVKTSRLYFMDTVLEDTRTTANLNYLINVKKALPEYFTFRRTLINKLGHDSEPQANDILAAGQKIVSTTYKNMKITQTPTLLIYNLKTRKVTLIEGLDNILKITKESFK